MPREDEGLWGTTRLAKVDAPYAFVVDGQPTPDPIARAPMSVDLWCLSRLMDPRRHAWRAEDGPCRWTWR